MFAALRRSPMSTIRQLSAWKPHVTPRSRPRWVERIKAGGSPCQPHGGYAPAGLLSRRWTGVVASTASDRGRAVRVRAASIPRSPSAVRVSANSLFHRSRSRAYNRWVSEQREHPAPIAVFGPGRTQLGRLLGAPWATREQLPEAGASR